MQIEQLGMHSVILVCKEFSNTPEIDCIYYMPTDLMISSLPPTLPPSFPPVCYVMQHMHFMNPIRN